MQTFLLIIATTVLVCGGLAGYYFLHLFAHHALAPSRLRFQSRGVYIILALVAFAFSFGSGRLLGYLLSRV